MHTLLCRYRWSAGWLLCSWEGFVSPNGRPIIRRCVHFQSIHHSLNRPLLDSSSVYRYMLVKEVSFNRKSAWFGDLSAFTVFLGYIFSTSPSFLNNTSSLHHHISTSSPQTIFLFHLPRTSPQYNFNNSPLINSSLTSKSRSIYRDWTLKVNSQLGLPIHLGATHISRSLGLNSNQYREHTPSFVHSNHQSWSS